MGESGTVVNLGICQCYHVADEQINLNARANDHVLKSKGFQY